MTCYVVPLFLGLFCIRAVHLKQATLAVAPGKLACSDAQVWVVWCLFVVLMVLAQIICCYSQTSWHSYVADCPPISR